MFLGLRGHAQGQLLFRLKGHMCAAQERMRAGPHFAARLNPRLLQAISDNPELLQARLAASDTDPLNTANKLTAPIALPWRTCLKDELSMSAARQMVGTYGM